DLKPNKLRRHFRQFVERAFRPAKLESDVSALNVAEVLQALPQEVECCRRVGPQHPDARKLLPLLRMRRQRPRPRAPDKRDELAPLHSITSSAVVSSEGGTVRPSILAVGWLMTNSNLLDCTTGISATFAPLRMRPA